MHANFGASSIWAMEHTLSTGNTMEYDEFGFVQSESAPAEPHVPMREQFPTADAAYLGGHSDGWEYRSVFAGSTLANSYAMVRQFLEEEGYADVPIPVSADELRLFRRPKARQLQLFGEHGYVHNPIKILFHSDPKKRNTLILCVYNEQVPGHLLRFHGLVK